jgi:rare lipoprotein A
VTGSPGAIASISIAAALVLGGCTTTHHVMPAKAVSTTAPRSTAPGTSVKIGQPYQVLGQWYYPSDDRGYDTTGVASWYGPGFHGLSTANGEPYDQDGLTAAHKTLPLPCYVEVSNLENGRQLVVRVNDRGPFVGTRLIDLSRRSAQLLGIDRAGTAKVRVRRVFPDSLTIAALALPKPLVTGTAVALAVPQSAPTPAPTPVAVATVAVPPVVAAAPFRSGTTFVQVAALSDQGRAAWLSGYLKPFGSTVIERASAGLWRVRLGPYQSRAEATLILAQVQAAGYTAAQIVAAATITPASTTPAR